MPFIPAIPPPQYEISTTMLGEEGVALNERLKRISESPSVNSQRRDFLRWDIRRITPQLFEEQGPEKTFESLQSSEKFIRLFPEGLELPEVAVDQDGISFDWDFSKGNMVSITPLHNHLIYAAKVGGFESEYGKAIFVQEIPKKILDLLSRASALAGLPS